MLCWLQLQLFLTLQANSLLRAIIMAEHNASLLMMMMMVRHLRSTVKQQATADATQQQHLQQQHQSAIFVTTWMAFVFAFKNKGTYLVIAIRHISMQIRTFPKLAYLNVLLLLFCSCCLVVLLAIIIIIVIVVFPTIMTAQKLLLLAALNLRRLHFLSKNNGLLFYCRNFYVLYSNWWRNLQNTKTLNSMIRSH